MDVTTTSTKIGKFDARFFHLIFEEEFAKVELFEIVFNASIKCEVKSPSDTSIITVKISFRH